MRQIRWLPLILALAALLAANLRVQYRVRINGEELPGTYSAAVLRQSMRAAETAAEEILRCDAKMPEVERRPRLSLRRPDNDGRALTEALLRPVSGVASADAVFLNGLRLGTVPDGSELCRGLRELIREQMPASAVSGNISGQLMLRRVYTRAEAQDAYDELLAQITGMAPVIYLDGSGKLA